MLLLNEFELVVWTCFNTEEKIRQLICDQKSEPDQAKGALNHLINTAYFTKRQCTSESQFSMVKCFFDSNFIAFQGRHTDWLLLNEPETSEITTILVNSRFN